MHRGLVGVPHNTDFLRLQFSLGASSKGYRFRQIRAAAPSLISCCLGGVEQSDNGTLVSGLILYQPNSITDVSFGY